MPNEPQIKRVVAFVDGQALFHSAEEAFGYRTPNYDAQALATALCGKLTNWNLVQTRFYTGIPSPLIIPKWHAFWTAKLHAMRSQGIHVFAREIRHTKKVIELKDGSTHTEIFSEEKGVDIRIALDIVRLAHEKTYDIALIFSQDQDFSEVVEDVDLISRQQIRWIALASALPFSESRKNLRHIRGTSRIEIDRATYDACLDQRDYLPEAYKDKPVTGTKELSDEEKFLAGLESDCGSGPRLYAEHILLLVKVMKLELHWPTNGINDRVFCMFLHQNVRFPVLIITTDGTIRVPVMNKTNRLIFPGKDSKIEFLREVNTIPNISISEEKFREDPCIQIGDLLQTDLIDSFFDAIDWLIKRIKSTPIPVEEDKPKLVETNDRSKIVPHKAKAVTSRPSNRTARKGRH